MGIFAGYREGKGFCSSNFDLFNYIKRLLVSGVDYFLLVVDFELLAYLSIYFDLFFSKLSL